MFHAWRDPIRLPRFWHYLLHGIEILGPVSFGVLSLLVSQGTIDAAFWMKVCVGIAIATAAAVLVIRYVGFIDNPEKLYIDAIMEELGKEIWDSPPEKLGGPRQQHRITLFQLKRRIWLARWLNKKWTHKLVPRARVPQSGRRPRRTWLVNHHFTEDCEGVAGQVFAEGVLVSPELPDLHDLAGVHDNAYNEYARLTNDSVKAVRRERYYSRRIGGVTVLVHAKRWGVLILDSSDPTAVTTSNLQGKPARRTLSVLTRVLSARRT